MRVDEAPYRVLCVCDQWRKEGKSVWMELCNGCAMRLSEWGNKKGKKYEVSFLRVEVKGIQVVILRLAIVVYLSLEVEAKRSTISFNHHHGLVGYLGRKWIHWFFPLCFLRIYIHAWMVHGKEQSLYCYVVHVYVDCVMMMTKVLCESSQLSQYPSLCTCVTSIFYIWIWEVFLMAFLFGLFSVDEAENSGLFVYSYYIYMCVCFGHIIG